MRVPLELKKPSKFGPPPGLVNSVILMCVYGYFVLRFDKDPTNCYANDDSDERINDEEADPDEMKNTSNIGKKFNFIFLLLFFMTLI